ncbi:helix-turn-helix domain-containing protein [Thomasclavelia sp.]
MNEDIANYIRNRILQLRAESKISARDLSLSLSKGKAYISQIESGEHLPSYENLLYICDYFKISLSEFFDDSNTYPKLINQIVSDLKSLDKETLEGLAIVTSKLKK